MTDQIDNQFNNYAFIEPKLFNARHKREIQSTKINPVSYYFIMLVYFKFYENNMTNINTPFVVSGNF